MTPREWARLQGFPDNFIIPVSDTAAYKQFGNSVAVPAIQATAKQIFSNNLILIDSLLPQILSNIVFYFYSESKSNLVDLLNQVSDKNPLKFYMGNGHKFYEYKIKRFLTDTALGMMPSKVWTIPCASTCPQIARTCPNFFSVPSTLQK